MELIFSICIGIGLAAACGFRVFVPLLMMAVAARSGYLHLANGMTWIGTTPALVAFSVATAVEVGAYYVPWLDNLLDTIATPTAIVAGIVATASTMGEVSPFVQWTIAVLAGGSAAGGIQLGTTALRATTTVTTGGLANFLVATAELIGSILTAALAVFLPLLALIALGCLVVAAFLLMARDRKQSPTG